MAGHGCNTAKVTDGIVIALYSFLKLDVQGRERRNETHIHHNIWFPTSSWITGLIPRAMVGKALAFSYPRLGRGRYDVECKTGLIGVARHSQLTTGREPPTEKSHI